LVFENIMFQTLNLFFCNNEVHVEFVVLLGYSGYLMLQSTGYDICLTRNDCFSGL